MSNAPVVARHPDDPRPDAEAPGGDIVTVLIVDDDGFMRSLLQRVFRNAGVGVATFASAADLLARARLDGPAVLLLDVVMPDMSGLELQRLLRSRGVTLPMVFLTGSADIPSAVTAMRDGAFDFIEKPFEAGELVRRVRLAIAAAIVAAAPVAMPVPASRHARALQTLTPREREVHDLMVVGKTSKAIAQLLGGSHRTIEIHRTRVMTKMGVAHLADLVRDAFTPDPG